MEELNWIYKDTTRKGYADVSIRVSSEIAKKPRTGIHFRNNCFKKITNTEYFILANLNDRIYFKEADEKRGFKLSNKNKFGDSRSCQLTGHSTYLIDGDYDLLYDNKRFLYYIDLNLKY